MDRLVAAATKLPQFESRVGDTYPARAIDHSNIFRTTGLTVSKAPWLPPPLALGPILLLACLLLGCLLKSPPLPLPARLPPPLVVLLQFANSRYVLSGC